MRSRREPFSLGQMVVIGCLLVNLDQSPPGHKACPARLLSPGFHHLAWNADSRDQVDKFYRLLLDNDATVLDAPAEYDYEPGYYAVYFTDPDGMKLEFLHIPERPATNQ